MAVPGPSATLAAEAGPPPWSWAVVQGPPGMCPMRCQGDLAADPGACGNAASRAAVGGTRCGWEQAEVQLDKWLPCSSGQKPLADTKTRLGRLGVSLQLGVPVNTLPLVQLCQQAGHQRAGTGCCGSGGALGPLCLPAAPLWGPAVLGGGGGLLMQWQAVVGWEHPWCKELVGMGALPRAQPGWPPPAPVYSVRHLCERVRSAYEAGHVFSFSPDNDSRRRWAVSGHAHLLCRAALPQAQTQPQRLRQSWPHRGTWPLGPCSTRPSAPRLRPQPTLGASWHGPRRPLCLRLCFTWHSLSWPRLPSWPGAGGSTAPDLAPGLSQWLSLLCGPFLSPGLSQAGSSAPRWEVGPPRTMAPCASRPSHWLPWLPTPALFLVIWLDPISPLLVQAGYQGPGRLPGPGAAVRCGQQDRQPLPHHKRDWAEASLGPRTLSNVVPSEQCKHPAAPGCAAAPRTLGSRAGRTPGDCCQSICKLCAPQWGWGLGAPTPGFMQLPSAVNAVTSPRFPLVSSRSWAGFGCPHFRCFFSSWRASGSDASLKRE